MIKKSVDTGSMTINLGTKPVEHRNLLAFFVQPGVQNHVFRGKYWAIALPLSAYFRYGIF